MAAQLTLQRLHKLIWLLIYGGLLTLILGIATARTDEAPAQSLIVGGGVLAVVGVVLIPVRARLHTDPGP